MTRDEMVEEVQSILQDTSFSSDQLIADMDEALLDTAALVKLPGLDTSDVILTVTDNYHVPMPDDFHRDLYLVRQPEIGYPPTEILINLKSLEYMHNARMNAGPAFVRWCCEQNNIFYYRPIPETVQELTAFYYAKPESLDDDDEAHLVIPDHLHFDILVNKVAAKRFAYIEDGLDSQKVNAVFYQQEYLKGLAKLAALYPDAPRKPFRPIRKVSYF